MSLIRTKLITYSFEVPESDIRDALIMEAAEKHHLVDNGKIIAGVTASVTFDGRRGKSGQYIVTLTRDPEKSGQPRIGARGDLA